MNWIQEQSICRLWADNSDWRRVADWLHGASLMLPVEDMHDVDLLRKIALDRHYHRGVRMPDGTVIPEFLARRQAG